jgi:hypothetical protein
LERALETPANPKIRGGGTPEHLELFFSKVLALFSKSSRLLVGSEKKGSQDELNQEASIKPRFP